MICVPSTISRGPNLYNYYHTYLAYLYNDCFCILNQDHKLIIMDLVVFMFSTPANQCLAHRKHQYIPDALINGQKMSVPYD